MAKIYASGKLDGTSCYCQLDINYASRTKNTVTLNFTVSAGYTANGYTTAGYEAYTGKFVISGTNITSKTQNFTAKAKNVSWSGKGQHYTWTSSIVIDVSSKSNLNASISLSYSTSVGGTISSMGTLDIPQIIFNSKININGEWKDGEFYVKVNGEWKKATPYVKVNGEWKQI